MISHFRVTKTLTFKHKAKCETFLVKKSFINIRIKIIFISMDLQLTTLSKHSFGATRKWSIIETKSFYVLEENVKFARESMRSKDSQCSIKEKPSMKLKNHDTLP